MEELLPKLTSIQRRMSILYREVCVASHTAEEMAEDCGITLAQNPVQEFQLRYLASQVSQPGKPTLYDATAMQNCQLDIRDMRVPPRTTPLAAVPISPPPPKTRKPRLTKHGKAMARLQSIPPPQPFQRLPTPSMPPPQHFQRFPTPSPSVHSVRPSVEATPAPRTVLPDTLEPDHDRNKRQRDAPDTDTETGAPVLSQVDIDAWVKSQEVEDSSNANTLRKRICGIR